MLAYNLGAHDKIHADCGRKRLMLRKAVAVELARRVNLRFRRVKDGGAVEQVDKSGREGSIRLGEHDKRRIGRSENGVHHLQRAVRKIQPAGFSRLREFPGVRVIRAEHKAHSVLAGQERVSEIHSRVPIAGTYDAKFKITVHKSFSDCKAPPQRTICAEAAYLFLLYRQCGGGNRARHEKNVERISLKERARNNNGGRDKEHYLYE